MSQNNPIEDPKSLSSRRRQKRKPGGQPGNQNARKHGFYSNVLTPEQIELIGRSKCLKGLDEEIAVARMQLKTIMRDSPGSYTAIIGAMSALASLVRQKAGLSKFSRSRFDKALELVIRDLCDVPAASAPNPSSDGQAVSSPSQGNDATVT